MTPILLDFSQRLELALYAEIIGDVTAMLIMRNYLDEFLEWTDEEGFDYELAGARMLGRDVRSLLDHGGAERIGKLLAEQADAATPARLPAEMAPSDPDRARALLDAMLGGLIEGGDR